MVVNTNHKPSISRNPETPQPQLKPRAGARAVLAALALGAGALPAWAAENGSCAAALGTPAVRQGPLRTLGTTPVSANLALSPGHTYLIEVEERDNDALVEVLDAAGKVVASADHPERRTGTRRAVVTAPESGSVTVRVMGKENATAAGTAKVLAYDLAALQGRGDCLAIVKALEEADGDYAAGQEISRGHASTAARSARDAYSRAQARYVSAEHALASSGDRSLRGQTQLAIAGLEYYNLQDWVKTADWAKRAGESFGASDPYRKARAEALLAEAWIEIGYDASAAGRSAPSGGRGADLVTQARVTLRQLVAFHVRRHETYDAGLQQSNVAVTYLYQSRFQECVSASEAARRLFESIHETLRQGQAWQNTAVCLWGLGRLPEALHRFRLALSEIGPEPYPTVYLDAIDNTALLDYALGHFDESLRLFGRALTFSEQTETHLDEGESLHGIGLNYYALGDLRLARNYLERALVIRTVALDRRGRMATLRALATVAADEHRVDEAVSLDREALALAVAPTSVGLTKVQLAVHIAAAGHVEEAKKLLDHILSNSRGAYPLIPAQALVQRGVLLREMNRPREALADLAAARLRFHQLAEVSDEFAVNLELARTERILGEPRGALATLGRALREGDAVRGQSANPEFRSALQAPLRAAYDLKIELLRARYQDALAAGREDEADSLAAAAFVTADASRARTLEDVSEERYPPPLRRALAPELRRRDDLYQELAGRRYLLDSRLEHGSAGDPRARQLTSDIAELQRQVDNLNALIAARATPPHQDAHAAHRLQGLPTIPAHTGLVAYWIGSESAYAWVVLPGEIHWVRLASPTDIGDAAEGFHRSLARMADVAVEQRLSSGQALYDLVLRPLEMWLAGVRQWVVVPDGALDYVPFAALRNSAAGPAAFVVARHDVAFTPAAWMLDTSGIREIPHPRALLLVADPVYQADDSRLGNKVGGGATPHAPPFSTPDPAARDYQRLAYTAEEAAGIAAEFPTSQVDRLIGVDATRERLLALDWSKYRFIHLATHGTLNAQVPELSAVALSSFDQHGNPIEGAVRVADLSLQTLNADVAVFSGCDTALGKEVPSEGLVGISSTVLARGARAVVASLWPVSDEISAHLMTEFYRHMLRDSMAPAAALGAAMRAAVLREGSADPALWASYQVSVVAIGPGLPTHDAVTAATTIVRP